MLHKNCKSTKLRHACKLDGNSVWRNILLLNIPHSDTNLPTLQLPLDDLKGSSDFPKLNFSFPCPPLSPSTPPPGFPSQWKGPPGKSARNPETSLASCDRHHVLPCISAALFFVLLTFHFILKYSWFAMLCSFQGYHKVIHLHIHVDLFFFKFFSQLGCYRTLSWVPCAVQ